MFKNKPLFTTSVASVSDEYDGHLLYPELVMKMPIEFHTVKHNKISLFRNKNIITHWNVTQAIQTTKTES